ncbi:hypothetical protein [Spiroplasma citri]|uniref:hypothetical protein n=1 Tax=Spiroplasma citri TaxID=2133 RepID=UPI00090949EE|nr:hypothetical protein [Spiroplasma citri]APE74165.1 hypothetical protein SCITRI_00251 [Spiroplasma citri]
METIKAIKESKKIKNPILEKHFSNIRDQLKLVLNTEKINDSTPIQLLYDNVLLIRNNGRVITDEDFTYRLELVLADTYKTLSLLIDSLLQNAKTLAFSYFKEKLDIKEWHDNLYADAVQILKEKYSDKLMQIDFILLFLQRH